MTSLLKRMRRKDVSQRTAEYPMAFSGYEFLRGAHFAWLVFSLSLAIIILSINVIDDLVRGPQAGYRFDRTMLFFLIPLLCLFISAFPFVILGLPFGVLLATLMEKNANKRQHLIAFGSLGFSLAYLTLLIFITWASFTYPQTRDDPWNAIIQRLEEFGLLFFPIAVLVGISVMSGWAFTERRARREIKAKTGILTPTDPLETRPNEDG
ncbi:MAG: hypothetical protein WBA28_07665 [Microbacteriaceae bacterium]